MQNPGKSKVRLKNSQALIGVTADGNFGYRSRTALKKSQDETEAKRIEVLEQPNTIKAEKENNLTFSFLKKLKDLG